MSETNVTFRAGNPFKLSGKGTVEISGDRLVVRGRRSRPFWFSKPAQAEVPLGAIVDVRLGGKDVAFAVAHEKDKGIVLLPLGLAFESEDEAAQFAAMLPATVSEEGAQQAEFASRIAGRGSPVALAILALNVATWVAFGALGGGFMQSNSEMLIRWGSNFGPLTTSGEWWRLLTSTFLHGGFVHLAVNMYALFEVGRLTERLYGSRAFLMLYVLSGLLGSAASVWWNPVVNSVGASGALFGVLGASFVYMANKRNGVPMTIMATHLTSLAIFIAYGIFNGLAKSNIDNAAHLGGLIGGVLVGLALARPVGAEGPAARGRQAAAVLVCTVAILGLAFLTPNTKGVYESEKRFIADLNWFTEEERALIDGMNDVIGKARKPGFNLDELTTQSKGLAGRWEAAHTRFREAPLSGPSRLAQLQADMVAYTDSRRRAVSEIHQAFLRPEETRAHIDQFNKLMKEGDAIVARISARNAEAAAKKK